MNDIILLDGGMGQELIHRSKFPPSPLWSANVMMNEPEIVEAVHSDYIKAGATVLTLNTYSATPERLARDASEDLFVPLQEKAMEIAKRAIGDETITIAGCLPPLFASYKPELAPELDVCIEQYARIVDQQKHHVDVFLCETMSSIKEGKAATIAAKASGLKVFCSFSILDGDGTKLRSGEPLTDGVRQAVEAGADAVLVNCSWPESITQAMAILAEAGVPFGAYANGFTSIAKLDAGGTVDHLKARTDLGPEQYANHVMEWVDHGATIVGGCCEVGPAHIQYLHESLIEKGHKIVGSF